MAYIEIKNVKKEYLSDNYSDLVLDNISFDIKKNDVIAIMGPSASGKTTLLNLIGGILKPTDGSIIVDKTNVDKLKGRKLKKYIKNDISMIYQDHNLFNNLTALENIDLANEVVKNNIDVLNIIKSVGLLYKMNDYPSTLSRGEKQRVMVARALCKNAKVLLCDEPTTCLDDKGKKDVLKTILSVSKKCKMTVIITTHDSKVASVCNKVIYLKNGKISKTTTNKKPKKVGEIKW